MKRLIVSVLAFALCALAGKAAVSVTSGATVSLNGTFFDGLGSWTPGTNAAPQDLVNGVFQPEAQQWNFNSVWWNGSTYPANSIVLDLNGTFSITGFTVQADNNDVYQIDYLAPGSGVWQTAWTIPTFGTYGLNTRSQVLGSPITATQLRVEAIAGDG